MMNPVPAGVAGTIVEVCAENAELVEHDVPLFRVREPTRSAGDRHRRHDHARRQSEPLERDRPDDAGHRSRSRRRSTASASTRADFSSSTHMAVAGPLPRGGPVGAAPARQRGDAEHAAQLHHDRDALHLVGAVRRGPDAALLPLRRRNGIRRFQVADPTNDPRAAAPHRGVAQEEGVEEVVIGLTYSVSPVHTHSYYAERAAALADCADMDRLYLEDPGGLLTPDAVRELAPHFVAAAGERPLELHSHTTIGLAPIVYLEGAARRLPRAPHRRRAARARHVEPGRRDDGPRPRRTGFSHRLDLEALAEIADHFRRLAGERGCRSACPRSSTPPTTTTSSPAAWSRRRGGCSRSNIGPSCSTRCSRRSAACERRWATRSSSRRSRRWSLPRRSATWSTRSAGRTSPSRRSAISSDTTASRRRRRSGHRRPCAVAAPGVEELRHLEPIHLEGARARFGCGSPTRSCCSG